MNSRIAAVLFAAAALAAFALPATAGAALPKPRTTTLIVPGKSLAGVALGATAAKVQKEWGHSKDCEYQCSYEGVIKNGDESAARGSVLLEQPASGKGPAKVWEVFIQAGVKEVGTTSRPDFDTPLTEFRTAKGIGLGSKISEVQKAYPTAKKQASPGITYFAIGGKNEIATYFYCSNSTKVTSITVELHPGG